MLYALTHICQASHCLRNCSSQSIIVQIQVLKHLQTCDLINERTCEFVVVNNQIFLAHRVVVAVRCPALDNIQRINDCNVESFKALLYFLYTGYLLPGMNAVDRQQFNDLVNRFQIKTVVQSNNQTDDGLTRLFLAIQPKLKSRDQLAVEIR